MKKWLVMLLCLALSACALAGCGKKDAAKDAEPEELDPAEIIASEDHPGIKYILQGDGTAKIVEGHAGADDLEIPAELDGHRVTSIGDKAFAGCSSLTGVTIPEGVTSIGDGAFARCSSLTGVTIPDSVTEIGMNPFSGCYKLNEIKVSPGHPALAVKDGVLFSKADKRLVCYPCGFKAESYDIPQGIECIGGDAFAGCSSLTGVTIPEGVTSIGDRAFDGCSSLTGMTIPEGVTSIGKYAFYLCSSLTGVTIPASVTNIGNEAFYECRNLTLTVTRDSYAAEYCKENQLNYVYSDSDDWLSN